MGLLLLVLAVICLVWGVFALIDGALLFGLVLVLVGLVLGSNGRTRIE
jgi:hypothetical protein